MTEQRTGTINFCSEAIMKKDYSNVKFPQVGKYIRHSDRIYLVTDPEDGEVLTYFGRAEKPSSNALGYRWYRAADGTTRLVHFNEIEAV